MRRAGFNQMWPNVISFNAVISSCEKGGQRHVKLLVVWCAGRVRRLMWSASVQPFQLARHLGFTSELDATTWYFCELCPGSTNLPRTKTTTTIDSWALLGPCWRQEGPKNPRHEPFKNEPNTRGEKEPKKRVVKIHTSSRGKNSNPPGVPWEDSISEAMWPRNHMEPQKQSPLGSRPRADHDYYYHSWGRFFQMSSFFWILTFFWIINGFPDLNAFPQFQCFPEF